MTNLVIRWDLLDDRSQHILALVSAAKRQRDPVRQQEYSNVEGISEETPIDSVELLAGMTMAEPQTSELQQLLDYFSIPTDLFIDSLAVTGEWPDPADQPEPLDDMPWLDQEAERILESALNLAETFSSDGPPLVRPIHLLGAVLNDAGTPANQALREALTRGNVSTREIETVASRFKEFLSRDSPGGNDDVCRFLAEVVPRPLEPDFWARLSPSTRRALSHADRLARDLGQSEIHMEHLIAGLYEKPDGPTRQLFGPHLDAAALAALILREVESEVPTTATYDVRDGRSDLPPRSRHVETALQHARWIATRAGSPTIRSRHLLSGALLVEDCEVVKALIAAGIHREDIVFDDDDVSEVGRRSIAHVGTDSVSGEDRLGITSEVEALCSVIAAHDVRPPLAIGLFGDWGSGKSFFMEKMYGRVNKLKEVARKSNGNSAYCSNIVQIRFNAWHYIDSTNLWASLAAEIFEELSKALDDDNEKDLISGIESVAIARQRLFAATIGKQTELESAERAKKVAEEELQASQRDLDASRREAEEARIQLAPKLLVQAAADTVAKDDDVQQVVAQITTDRNFRAAGISQEEIEKQILGAKEVWSQREALRLALTAERRKRSVLNWVVPVVAALIIGVVSWVLIDLIASGVTRNLLATLMAGIAVVSPIAIPVIRTSTQMLSRIGEYRNSYVERVQCAAAVERKKLEEVHDQKLKKVEREQQHVVQVSGEIEQLNRQIDELRADWKLGDFIRQRHGSSVYTSHRGIIAQAHDDFEQLSSLLTKASAERRATGKAADDGTEKQLPIIDRIILYVDDLDRCPEADVVKVLQAVHLLLAFPLFVVVVGVDSRWLLHSLRQHSEAFQERDEDEDELEGEEAKTWQSTPLNYLEKIFQIPFALRPMDPDGFGRLIDELTTPKDEPTSSATVTRTTSTITVPDRQVESGVAQPEQIATDSGAPVGERTSEGVRPEPVASDGPVDSSTAGTRPDDRTPEPAEEPGPDANPAYLVIDQAEQRCMKAMAGLIGSPRAAKRFVNTYRLLKASFEERIVVSDVSDDERQQHQAPMMLLAILTGYPAEAMDLFDELLAVPPDTKWWEFVDSAMRRGIPADGSEPVQNGDVRKALAEAEQLTSNGNQQPVGGLRNGTLPDDRWAELVEKLTTIHSRTPLLIGDDRSCGEFQDWVPHVARYSYLSRNLLLRHAAERKDERTPAQVS